jgi:hypothetical protein
MFERVGNLAERVAIDVSRRAFLGRLGQGALGLAAAIGGVLAFPGQAHADPTKYCCIRSCGGFCVCKYTAPKTRLCDNGLRPQPCDSLSEGYCR